MAMAPCQSSCVGVEVMKNSKHLHPPDVAEPEGHLLHSCSPLVCLQRGDQHSFVKRPARFLDLVVASLQHLTTHCMERPRDSNLGLFYPP